MNKQLLLRHAALRASSNPLFVASALVHYQQVHQLSETELASWLEVVPESLPPLGLCRRPRTQQEVQQVAAYAGCMDEESAADLLLSAEGSLYMDWRGWLLLALILSLATWGL